MKKLVLIMAIAMFAPVMGNCSLSTQTEVKYPGDGHRKNKRKKGFNYKRHRRWVLQYRREMQRDPNCRAQNR